MNKNKLKRVKAVLRSGDKKKMPAALRTLKEESGLTTAGLALKAGVKPRTPEFWLSGKQTPSQASRELLIQFVGELENGVILI